MIIFNSGWNNFNKLLLFFLFLVSLNTFAQGPQDPCACDPGFVFDPSATCDPCDPFCLSNNCIPDTNIPIDNGIVFLFILGLVYGLFKLTTLNTYLSILRR